MKISLGVKAVALEWRKSFEEIRMMQIVAKQPEDALWFDKLRGSLNH